MNTEQEEIAKYYVVKSEYVKVSSEVCCPACGYIWNDSEIAEYLDDGDIINCPKCDEELTISEKSTDTWFRITAHIPREDIDVPRADERSEG